MRLPLPRVTGGRVLADWVTASLQEAILQGAFEPGERLDQEGIAREFEVSLTPVREALRRLEAEGFVEIRPHLGAFIPQVSPQDIRDIYDIRRLLEPEIVRRIVREISQETVAELDAVLDEAEASLQSGDIERYFTINVFDQKIRELSPNRLLKEMLDGFGTRIMMVRRFSEFQPGTHLAESVAEHRAVLAAMRQRDPEQAAELMRVHLSNAEASILRMVEHQSSPPAPHLQPSS